MNNCKCGTEFSERREPESDITTRVTIQCKNCSYYCAYIVHDTDLGREDTCYRSPAYRSLHELYDENRA